MGLKSKDELHWIKFFKWMIKLFCVLLFCHKPIRYTLWVLAFIASLRSLTASFLLWIVLAHTWMIQPATTSVCWVIRVVTHADDQLIMYISWAVSGSHLLMEAVRMYSLFDRKTQKPVKMFFFKGLYLFCPVSFSLSLFIWCVLGMFI